MPRPLGSLNRATVDKMVADGSLCLISQRASCVRCREAREAAAKAAAPAAVTPASVVPAGPVAAILVDTFVEYNAPDGKEWRIERGSDLLRDFAIPPAQLRQWIGHWHTAIVTQEQAWMLVRRYYGIAPMLGVSDPDDLRAWSLAELAEKLSLKESALDALLGETRAFWGRYRLSVHTEKKDGPAKMDARRPMLETEVKEILDLYGFGGLEGDDTRRYAARRCRDLAAYLEHDQGMPIAVSAIQQELNLRSIDARISALQAHHAARRKEFPHLAPEASDDKRLTDLIDARSKANKGYMDTMESLGATQVQTGAVSKRQSFHASMGGVMEAIMRYKSGEGNDLIDGFLTEAEFRIVTTEKELRPMQYRPDVVLLSWEAMERLWDREYEPSPVGKMRARRLRAAFASAVKAAQREDGETVVDATEEEMLGDEQGPAMPAALPGGETATAAPAPPPMPRQRNDGNDVAVF